MPIYVLGGYGDYSIPPRLQGLYPRTGREVECAGPESPAQLRRPEQVSTPSLPLVNSGKVQLPTSKCGTPYGWTSFWNESPRVKTTYRQSEHQLQAAEAISAIASLQSPFKYPVAPLYHSWLMMCLNMDRNTLWGAAGGMVFEHPTSWDARDRFEKVQELSANSTNQALQSLLGKGSAVGLFNPLNAKRTAPFLMKLPAGTSLKGVACQADADGQTLCRLDMPPMSAAGIETDAKPAAATQPISLPETIDTAAYSAKLDPASGRLTSLKVKPSGHELLAKPVLIVAERGADYHETQPRPNRQRLADSSQSKAEITVERGPLATVVRTHAKFYGGGELRQTIRFYDDDPRIDFEVETEAIPDNTLVVVEFPLAPKISEMRRGIPYGFSHAACGKPNPQLTGLADGIFPAIRWSDYTFSDGGGAVILDRGLTGRELNGNTPVLFLTNAHEIYMGYRCSWLSGRPRQKYQFALLAHDGDWDSARVPQQAWQYNAPPLVRARCGTGRGKIFRADFR